MMKKIALITSIFMITLGSNSQAQKNEKMKFDNNEIVGEMSLKKLETLDGFEHIQVLETFKGDQKQLEKLTALLQNVKIEAYIGTWCEDTQYWLPQIMQLLQHASYPIQDIELIGIDREKKNPEEVVSTMKITHVPTIIFYREGNEVGRMVEQPAKSLMADFTKILSDK